MRPVTPKELKHWLDKGEDIQIVDVREYPEHVYCRLDKAVHIPMNSIPDYAERIDDSKPVVFYCHTGLRSKNIAFYLNSDYMYENLYVLQGGIDAWARDIDTSMKRYNSAHAAAEGVKNQNVEEVNSVDA